MGSDRELCRVCHGNGVVKIPGGVSQCDHCEGLCWEPLAPPATSGEALERMQPAARRLRAWAEAVQRVDGNRALAVDLCGAADTLEAQAAAIDRLSLVTHDAALVARLTDARDTLVGAHGFAPHDNARIDATYTRICEALAALSARPSDGPEGGDPV